MAQNKTGGVVALSHRDLGERFFFAEGASALLFTENETNTERLAGTPNPSPYVKDGIGNYIVHGKKDAVNPEKRGTKVSAHYPLTLGAGESRTVRLRLSDRIISVNPPPPLPKGGEGKFQAARSVGRRRRAGTRAGLCRDP
jgi:hypothetical protein